MADLKWKEAIEAETAKLIADDDEEKNSGIYAYILTRDERHLGIRVFSDSVKQKFTKNRMEIVSYAKSILTYQKWKATTLHLGMKTEKQ